MTLTQIRSVLRVIADCPYQTPWKDANLNTIIFSVYREVVNEITRRNPDYYITTDTVSTTASTEFSDLPGDCTILKKLTDSDGNTLNWVHNSQFDHTIAEAKPQRFDRAGSQVWWNPVPDAVYAYTAFYHYQPDDLSADSDVPDIPVNFHDILAYGAAVKARIAKEDKINEYMATYQGMLDNLLHQVSISQTNNARRVLRAYNIKE